MHLDLSAPSRRRKPYRGLRLALVMSVLAAGAGITSITLTDGAHSAAFTANGSEQAATTNRQSLSLAVPDPTSSATAMQSAVLARHETNPSGGEAIAKRADDRNSELLLPRQKLLTKASGQDTRPERDLQGGQKPQDNSEPSDQARTAASASKPPESDEPDPEPAQDSKPEWQKLSVEAGDSLATLFRSAGLDADDTHAVLNAHERASALRRLHPGEVIAVRIDEQGQLLGLRYGLTEGETLELTRAESGYEASIHTVELERRIHHSSAIIRSSLFDAGSRVGLEDELLLDIAGIFRWDIDFALDIRRGDAFTIIYEAYYRNGDKVRNGNILAAEFVNRGQTFRAVRYSNDAQQANYYDPQGRAMRKTFLRSPVDFTRVSSEFARNRLHPTLGKRRAHLGTDYAASTGTPIKATGDGRVVHRGWKGGYGRTIVLKHAGRYTTLYAHMSGFRGGLSRGDYVEQGQTIGYVGSSGRSTGPHLHYEFRVNGRHRDPQRVDLPSAKPIPERLRAAFQSQTDQLLSRLDIYSRIRLAVQGELRP